MAEIVAEVKMSYPGIVKLFPNFTEMVNDLAALAIKDRSSGYGSCLEEFIASNLGSAFHYLELFFRAQSGRWYTEIIQFVSNTTSEYDEFFIEDVWQITPNLLSVRIWAEYRIDDRILGVM
jgi:hypothetical protein